MKKILFIFLFFTLSCEKEPVVPIEPPKVNPPTITFEGHLSPENNSLDIEYGQGRNFSAKTEPSAKITYADYTGIVSDVVRISLKEMTKDTTFLFTATSSQGLVTTKSLTFKVPAPDPFFSKLIGVWKETGKRVGFDYPGGDRSKPMEWKVSFVDTTSCAVSRRDVYTLDKRYLQLMSKNICGEFPKSGGSPWFTIKPERKDGIDMYHFRSIASDGYEKNGTFEYLYFKGDTLVYYQEIRLDPSETIFRSFKVYRVLETKDYKSYVHKNGDSHLLATSKNSSDINISMGLGPIRFTSGVGFR